VGVSEFLIAIFTGILAIATWLLWRATTALVRGAADTASRQLRAYIAVEPRGVNPFRSCNSSAATESIARAVIRNVGQVPARDVAWFVDAEVSDDADRQQFPTGNLVGGCVVQPRTEMMLLRHIKLSTDDITNVRTNDWYVYVWGKVTYIDGFGDPRFTLFCHRYDRDGIDAGPIDVTSVPRITAESATYHIAGTTQIRGQARGRLLG
jgi:hypothetical protein